MQHHRYQKFRVYNYCLSLSENHPEMLVSEYVKVVVHCHYSIISMTELLSLAEHSLKYLKTIISSILYPMREHTFAGEYNLKIINIIFLYQLLGYL